MSGLAFCLQLCDQPAHPRYGKPGGFGDRSLCMPAVAIREKNGFVTLGFAKVIRQRPCRVVVLRAGYFAAWFGDDARRVFDIPFFQLGLTASTLGFSTVGVTPSGYLLSDNKYNAHAGHIRLGCASRTRKMYAGR